MPLPPKFSLGASQQSLSQSPPAHHPGYPDDRLDPHNNNYSDQIRLDPSSHPDPSRRDHQNFTERNYSGYPDSPLNRSYATTDNDNRRRRQLLMGSQQSLLRDGGDRRRRQESADQNRLSESGRDGGGSSSSQQQSPEKYPLVASSRDRLVLTH